MVIRAHHNHYITSIHTSQTFTREHCAPSAKSFKITTGLKLKSTFSLQSDFIVQTVVDLTVVQAVGALDYAQLLF